MPKVKPGLEVFAEQHLNLVRGKRVGIVTNHSAVTRDLVHILDYLRVAGVNITALYGPEHGIRGDVADGAHVPSGQDKRTGIPVHSLYGPTVQPTPQMLADVDVILFDIQDIGCRYYTYLSTMSYVLRACAENKKQVIILDRPNPINGLAVEGNILNTNFVSFIGLHPIPIRHGMTIGEMAQLLNGQFGFCADLEVVVCQGWKRAMWFDETGLPWVMPSPNMPNIDAALLYPGLCLLEGTSVSEGRGTSKPFEFIGAPWVDGYALADRLNSIGLPGVRFRPVHFIPTASKHKEQMCSGVQAHITDRNFVRSIETGLHIIKTLHDMYPKEFHFKPPGTSGKYFFDLLAGTDETRTKIEEGISVEGIMASWYTGLADFQQIRQKYLLYS